MDKVKIGGIVYPIEIVNDFHILSYFFLSVIAFHWDKKKDILFGENIDRP